MSVSTPSKPEEVVITYEPRGAALDLQTCRDDEVLIAGPAGTGKSRGGLEKLNLVCLNYPGSRHVMLRKTLASLTSSALVTFQQKVLHPLDNVRFFGGSSHEPAQFRYPNGSAIVVGGLDKSEKVMSAEYDTAYINEALELTLEDWENVTTRLRNGVMPYQQLVADCNPGPPKHWLKQRCDIGQTTLMESRHEDNPVYFTADGRLTEAGIKYMVKLDALTGVRRLRLRKGIWAAAEGVIYDGFDPAVHLIDRFDIPASWSRYWVVDFGYTNPFCWQAWAHDPDGRLIMYREIYYSQRIVEDHAEHIKAATIGEPRPRAIICDHDAEDRATLERKLGMVTTQATKTVKDGLDAVMSRLRPAGDLKPRLFLMRDSLVERDPVRDDALLPACTEEEFPGYVWDLGNGQKKGDQPLKKDDHGMDAVRYIVAALDLTAPAYAPIRVPVTPSPGNAAVRRAPAPTHVGGLW